MNSPGSSIPQQVVDTRIPSDDTSHSVSITSTSTDIMIGIDGDTVGQRRVDNHYMDLTPTTDVENSSIHPMADQSATPIITVLNDHSEGTSESDVDMTDELDETTPSSTIEHILVKMSTDHVDFTLTPKVQLMRELWPKDFRTKHDALSKRVTDPVWQLLLAHWSEWERSHKFQNPVSDLSQLHHENHLTPHRKPDIPPQTATRRYTSGLSVVAP